MGTHARASVLIVVLLHPSPFRSTFVNNLLLFCPILVCPFDAADAVGADDTADDAVAGFVVKVAGVTATAGAADTVGKVDEFLLKLKIRFPSFFDFK